MNAGQRNSRHLDYLEHIAEAIKLARSHVEGLGKADFLADKKTQQAVILNLIVIGEAATQVLLNTLNLPPRILGCRGKKCAGCATVWRMVTSKSTSMSFGIPCSNPCLTWRNE